MQVASTSSRATGVPWAPCKHQQQVSRCLSVQSSSRLRQQGLRRRHVAVAASKPKTTGNAALDEAIETGKGLVDSAANLVPADVPRPVAKGGVALAGGIIAFWLLQKVLSTVVTFGLLGAAAWLYFKSSAGSSSRGSSSRSTSDGDYDDDPLSEARKIMDKYKAIIVAWNRVSAFGGCNKELPGVLWGSKRGMAAAALDHDAADFDEQDVLYDESDRDDSEASEAEAEPAAEPDSGSEEEELLDMDQDEGGLTIEGTHSESQTSSTLRVSLIASPEEVGKHAASPRMDVPVAKYPRQLAGCASMPARTSYVRMGTSAPINIPNMARWRPDKGSAEEGGQASTFVPPHQLSKQQQDFTFSFSGASPSAAVKRERLRTRNAILRSTGFLEPGATAAAAAAAAAAVARTPVQSSLTAALTTIGEL